MERHTTIESKDGIKWAKEEWEELLDNYNLEQMSSLYWQIFDTKGRFALSEYYKKRIIKSYNERKKK